MPTSRRPTNCLGGNDIPGTSQRGMPMFVSMSISHVSNTNMWCAIPHRSVLMTVRTIAWPAWAMTTALQPRTTWRLRKTSGQYWWGVIVRGCFTSCNTKTRHRHRNDAYTDKKDRMLCEAWLQISQVQFLVSSKRERHFGWGLGLFTWA
jgi:hypothetical protein